jgi:hypothetical protein
MKETPEYHKGTQCSSVNQTSSNISYFAVSLLSHASQGDPILIFNVTPNAGT